MPAGPRVPARPAAGPGRGKTRPRRRPLAPAPPAPAAPVDEADAPPAPPRRRWRSDFTARAIALAVVLLVLVISYATSLRTYVAQTRDIADTRAQIAERQTRITQLEDEIAQWDDDGYVRTQARERLGWVVPGETGFTVVDANGKPVGGGEDIAEEVVPEAAPPSAWWAKMWGSVAAADRRPVPAAPVRPQTPRQPPVTEDTRPQGSKPR